MFISVSHTHSKLNYNQQRDCNNKIISNNRQRDYNKKNSEVERKEKSCLFTSMSIFKLELSEKFGSLSNR